MGIGEFKCSPTPCEKCTKLAFAIHKIVVKRQKMSGRRKKDDEDVIDVEATIAEWRRALSEVEDKDLKSCVGEYLKGRVMAMRTCAAYESRAT